MIVFLSIFIPILFLFLWLHTRYVNYARRIVYWRNGDQIVWEGEFNTVTYNYLACYDGKLWMRKGKDGEITSFSKFGAWFHGLYNQSHRDQLLKEKEAEINQYLQIMSELEKGDVSEL